MNGTTKDRINAVEDVVPLAMRKEQMRLLQEVSTEAASLSLDEVCL